MKKIGMAAVAVLSLGFGGEASAAPVQWTSGPGANFHYYELFTTQSTFAAALANAAGAAPIAGQVSYLATVTSAEENAFIINTVFPAANEPLGYTWLGGSDAAVEGVWRWVAGPEAGTVFWNGDGNGSSPTYANFQPGEPNNEDDEDGVSLAYFGSSTWNDYKVGSTSNYLVEWSAAPDAVPEPETWAMMMIGFGLVGGTLRLRRRIEPALV